MREDQEGGQGGSSEGVRKNAQNLGVGVRRGADEDGHAALGVGSDDGRVDVGLLPQGRRGELPRRGHQEL